MTRLLAMQNSVPSWFVIHKTKPPIFPAPKNSRKQKFYASPSWKLIRKSLKTDLISVAKTTVGRPLKIRMSGVENLSRSNQKQSPAQGKACPPNQGKAKARHC
jgi:hypothetical protein